MAKMSKRKTAWLIILVIIGAGIAVRFWKGKGAGMKIVSKVLGKPEIISGVESKEYKYRFVSGDSNVGDKIVIVTIEGEITNSKTGSYYRRGMVDELINQLNQAEKDDSVKAIILSINSPGGPVIDADILYSKIREIGKKKPVVALLDKLAASGGYYVASAAQKIVAHPLTLTGNIGVIMDFVNLEGLLEKKLGVEMNVIKSGRYKDIGSPFRSMDSNEKKMLQELVNGAHRRFVESVSAGRKIPLDKLAPLADGRIFSGEQAKSLGLVDELGTQGKAVEVAKKLCGIEKAKVVEYYSRPRFLDLLFSKVSDYSKLKEVQLIPEPVLKYIWQPLLER